MPSYHILSMDGGGIRGLLTIIIIQRLEAAHPGFLDQIDLFAGTSTGGILALGLAYGLSPQRIRGLYETSGRRVFADTILDDIRDLGKLIGADYSLDALKEELSKEFGTHTLGDLDKKVLVTTFDLDNKPDNPLKIRTWKAKFFHNFSNADSDAHEKIVDVALRTSAAPTYFPIYQGYIDGGVVATNPSVSALAQALHPETGNREIHDLVLLSIGTGISPRYLSQLDADWGLAQWAPHLVGLMLEGGAGLADYQSRQILGERYLRVNPVLPVPIDLDGVEQIPLLQDIANQVDIQPTLDWLNIHF
ncbi:MAG TPA: patatin-like phospholipase family protein [Anaerolineales bacterium]